MVDEWMNGWIVRGLRLSAGRGKGMVCSSMPWGNRVVGVHSIGTGKQARWGGKGLVIGTLPWSIIRLSGALWYG